MTREQASLARPSLCLASAPGFRERLLGLFADGVRPLIINLGELAYLDSVGFGILVGSPTRSREAAGDVQLRGARGQVSEVLEITGVGQLFEVQPG